MKTSCEFQFGFLDVSARGDAQLSVTQTQPFARVTDINSEKPITPPKVLTLEPNFGCPLDGSGTLLPDTPESIAWGWWSAELSGEGGRFAREPVLTVRFSDDRGAETVHSSAGLTFTFAATLPKEVQIAWYGRGGMLLAEQSFAPDRFTYFCERQVEDYSKLVIRIPSMRFPGRYLRVTRLLFGVLELLDETRIGKAVLQEEVDPSLLTLPISTLELDFFTANGRFSLLDPMGAYQLFQWKQKIEANKSLDGVNIPLGSYYLQEAEGTVDAVTKLSCVDMLGILDTVEYDGGLYEDTPLSQLLTEILAPEGFQFALDPTFADVTIRGHLPVGSKREALWQIAFAIGAMMYPARRELLQVIPLPTRSSGEISPARKQIGHHVKLEKLVTQVDVVSHQYVRSEEESKDLQRADLGVGEHKITFSTPVSVVSVEGATLVSAHANYCVVNVDTAGEVRVLGYDYADTTTVHTVKVTNLPAGAKQGVERIEGATLLDPAKAPAAAQRLYDYYQNRYTDEGGTLPGVELAGERQVLHSLGGRTLTAYTERVVTDLHDGCLQTLTLRGR